MCGIVGFTGKQNAAPILLSGLKKLEYRGYDSAGIAVEQDGVISVSKVSGRIANLCEKTQDGASMPGCSGIGHTRWATHGAPTDANAHPHMSGDGRFSVVHNGIIENYAELRKELMGKGYVFVSQTDTEVIVHLIEMYYSGNFRQAVMKATSRLTGSYALGVLCGDYPGTIIAVREASPLILGIGVGENYFASDVTALVAYTRNAIYLDDGELAELTPDSIAVYDCAGRAIQKPVSRITWSVEAAEKGGYEHFMLKEIMEQPRAVKAALTPRIQNGTIKLDDFDFSAEQLGSIRKILITACGSAYYAGCAGKYAIEKLCRIPVDVQLASELRYSEPQVDQGTLLIVLSQSGETAEGVPEFGCTHPGHCQRGGQYHRKAGRPHPLYLGWAGDRSGYHKGLYHAAFCAVPVCSLCSQHPGVSVGRSLGYAAEGIAGPSEKNPTGAGYEPETLPPGRQIFPAQLRILYRTQYGLRGSPGGRFKAEGNLLYPCGSLCGR